MCLLERAGEALPDVGGDVQDGAVAVGGIADQDAAAFGNVGLYAVGAIVRAVAGLAPGGGLDAVTAVVTAVGALAKGRCSGCPSFLGHLRNQVS